jgi:hypothetical protein
MSRRKTILLQLVSVAPLFLSACASAPATPACTLPEGDRAWVDRALEAWHFTSREITGIGSVEGFEAVFFSGDCVITSSNALSTANAREASWTATPHQGTITLPDGTEMEAGVTSYVSGEKGLTYFVMSTPSVWQAAGIPEGPGNLIPVLLHEGSHVAQIKPYGPRLGALIEKNKLPDSFNDNAVQERFRDDQEFATSVKEETRLFIEAARTKDDAEARTLARKGMQLLRARQAKWSVGEDAYLVEAEDLWLTFEGAGQWTAYAWLVHPNGAAQPPPTIIERFLNGRHWSQTEGFAIVMALDRVAGPEWKRHAFGDGERTVLEMLDDALANAGSDRSWQPLVALRPGG